MTMDIHDQDWFLFMEHSEKKKNMKTSLTFFLTMLQSQNWKKLLWSLNKNTPEHFM